MNRTFASRTTQLDPDEVKIAYSEIVNERYFCVALLTALIYHSILTMKEEVRYFYPKPVNHISLIYFANRYIGVLSAVSSVALSGLSQNLASCGFFVWSIGLCNLLTVLLTDYILVLRVQALYQKGKRITLTLNCLLGLEAAVDLAILIQSNIRLKEVVVVEPHFFSACGSVGTPLVILGIISWIVPLAFGFLLLILSLYKAAEYWKLSSGFKGLHLIKVLIRDQVLYYGLAIFCCAFNIAGDSTFIGNNFLSGLLNLAGSPTLLCILGGQLLINLKEAGELGVNGGTNYRSQSVSEIDFAEGPAPVEAQATQSIAASEV